MKLFISDAARCFARTVCGTTLFVAGLTADAATLVVRPGQSIQAAIDRAASGDRIEVLPGRYQESGRPCPHDPSVTCALVVTTDNLTLVGRSDDDGRVVLTNPGGLQNTGLAVAKNGARGSACLTDPKARVQRSRVRGFTVRDFQENGILLLCVDDWSITESSAINNGQYGFFPSHGGKGIISGSFASGSNDTGFYVGQSHDVRVTENVATGNVSGFEIESSTRVRADHNLATGNTGGLLAFIQPGVDVVPNQNDSIEIDDNFIVANNKANTCTPGGDVCLVPVGTGILDVGGRHNSIHDNVVLGNHTVGIAVSDECTGFQIPVDICPYLGFDPLPRFTQIEENIVRRNGLSPDVARLPPGVPGADLTWTGQGEAVCWEHNRTGTTFSPLPLPLCP